MRPGARALALLGVSALCAGLAASIVHGYASDIRRQVGPLVSVLVAKKELPRGRLLTSTNVQDYVSEARVPARFAPPHSFRFARDAIGLRALTSIPAGSYLGETQLGMTPARDRPLSPLRSGGERLVEVPVTGASAVGGALRPGARVDVLVTSERGPGSPRTYLALQRVELVDFRFAGGSTDDTDGKAGNGIAALRVTLRQAVLLTAAQNFARELRLVARAPGDDRRISATAVTARQLHP